jgi:hypothetical protein
MAALECWTAWQLAAIKTWLACQGHRGRDVLQLAIDVAGLGHVGSPVMPRFGGAHQRCHPARSSLRQQMPFGTSSFALFNHSIQHNHSIHNFWQGTRGRKREDRKTDRWKEEGEGEKGGRKTATCR